MMSAKSPAAFAILANSGNAIRIWWSGEERERAERIAAEDFPGLPLVELYTGDALRDVEEQRDQLLAALRDCVLVMERDLEGLKVIQPELNAARAAIAAVEQPTACAHSNPILQHTGDGTPVEFCPDCGRNQVVGRAPEGGAA